MRKEVIKLMKVLRIIGRSIRDSFKSIVRNFSLSFASIMCTTITLILVAVALVCAANIENMTKLIEGELSIVVYLEDDTTEEQIENIRLDISSKENIEDVILKTKDEWKLELIETDEIYDLVFNYYEENPLQDSFTVKVNNIENLKDTALYIKDLDHVETVKYGDNMIDMVIKVFDVVEKVVGVVVIALVLITAFLISNTIKLTIFSRRNEIEIMRLVGASNLSIKLPFLIEGFTIGIIGSIIPICVTIYGYVILYSILGGQFTNMLILIKPYNFVFYVSLVLVAIGGVVGMYGSLKAVRKYLKI